MGEVFHEERPARMVIEPTLTIRPASGAVRGVVLVLHGGRADGLQPARRRQLSPARMIPFAHQLHSAGSGQGLEVWSLLYRVRGWNGARMSPLHDARWALARIRARHPAVPVYLLGHSMGGRVALHVADDAQVRAVVALAPWLEGATPVAPVARRELLIMHGTTDRWTSAGHSLNFSRRALGVAAGVRYVSVRNAGHFMLSRHSTWHRLTTSFVLKRFAVDTGVALTRDQLQPAEELLAAPDPLGLTA